VPTACIGLVPVRRVAALREHLALDDPTVGITPAIAFPRPFSTVVLEEPIGEIVTTDNAPWWAQSIGRVQRIDAHRAARFVEAVISASEAEARGTARNTAPRVA